MSKYGGGITTDFWTDDYQRNPYIAITAHFINDDWVLKTVLIGIYQWDLEKSQSAENVYAFFNRSKPVVLLREQQSQQSCFIAAINAIWIQ